LVDVLTESFIHLVRNAVSHGIETPKERLDLGKKEEGVLKLKARREGSVVIFEIEDDGAGLNYRKIKEKAIQFGYLDQYEADNIRNDKLANLIFQPGFSTKSSTGDISGRGVGLDVVKNIVESLNGSIHIESIYGQGTTFIITVPVSLLISDYLLLKENKQIFSVPIVSVQETFDIDISNIKKIGELYFYKLRDEVYEIHDLGLLLKQTKEAVLTHKDVGVLVDGPRKKYIITVEEIVGRETAVTKKTGKLLEGLRHFIGATISPHGEIRLIIDPVRLMENKLGVVEYRKSAEKTEYSRGLSYSPNSVLVVDDSISVRKYLTKLLTDAGYKVETAYDGANALSILESRRFDLIISDLEMPVMHGYELIENVRKALGDNQTAIFVLTSRATDKHKAKAFEVGANDFLVKPFNDDEVLLKIEGVMSERT
jgi:chemosensory pili system protein ChpA (sensor histidine kinase/response regulator)